MYFTSNGKCTISSMSAYLNSGTTNQHVWAKRHAKHQCSRRWHRMDLCHRRARVGAYKLAVALFLLSDCIGSVRLPFQCLQQRVGFRFGIMKEDVFAALK